MRTLAEFREREYGIILSSAWLSGTYHSLIEISQGFCPFDISLWLITFVNERQQTLDVTENVLAWIYSEASGNGARFITNYTVLFHEIWAMGPIRIFTLYIVK